jgi:hypothetical protein
MTKFASLRKNLNDGEVKTIDFQGYSMYPSIKPNSKIDIVKKSFSVGEIVVFEDKNQLVCHRIVSLKDDKVVTKGDHMTVSDRPILRRQIIGVVIKINGRKVNALFPKIKLFFKRFKY